MLNSRKTLKIKIVANDYNCKGLGHIATNCLTPRDKDKKDKKGKKVLNMMMMLTSV